MSSLEFLKKKALSDPRVKAEYDALEPEFKLIRARSSMCKTTALKMAIEAGEQSGQCSLSLHDIAKKVKQKHNV